MRILLPIWSAPKITVHEGKSQMGCGNNCTINKRQRQGLLSLYVEIHQYYKRINNIKTQHNSSRFVIVNRIIGFFFHIQNGIKENTIEIRFKITQTYFETPRNHLLHKSLALKITRALCIKIDCFEAIILFTWIETFDFVTIRQMTIPTAHACIWRCNACVKCYGSEIPLGTLWHPHIWDATSMSMAIRTKSTAQCYDRVYRRMAEMK